MEKTRIVPALNGGGPAGERASRTRRHGRWWARFRRATAGAGLACGLAGYGLAGLHPSALYWALLGVVFWALWLASDSV